MSQPVPISAAESGKLAANQSFIRGRITDVNRNENGCYTRITLPAPDQYSSPQSIEVRSKSMLGKPQDDVSVRVSIAGFRRGYKDKHGEQQYAVNVILVALDD